MSIVPNKIEITKYTPTCDFCGLRLRDADVFHEAITIMKEEGWKSQEINGEWCDICTDCQEEAKQWK